MTKTIEQLTARVREFEEEIERLKKHQCAPVCIFHEGDEREELKKQLAAAQEELRSRYDFIAMLQETQKDQLAKAEQRVAEAICELLESQHTWLTKEAASALIRHKFVKDV